MKKILLTTLIICMATMLHAQVVFDYLRAADNYFNKADYYSATEYYEKYLGVSKGKTNENGFAPYVAQPEKSKKAGKASSSKEEAIYKLAESYRLLHFHVKSLPYYQQAATFDKNKFPLAGYYYAANLRALEKYPEAELAFNDFLQSYPNNDVYQANAKREVENLKFIQQQLNKQNISDYTIAKPAGGLPDSGAVYAPVLYNNTFYFTSTKGEANVPKLQVHNNRVYEANYTGSEINNITKTALPEMNDVHQGVISINPNGDRLLLTRWSITNGKKNASLYMSSKTATGWSDPLILPSTINVSGYNAQQAYFMPEGNKIIFSSDMPGGLGGFDLYTADITESGDVNNVQNLGATINTVNDEQAPYYHEASKQLVFSSNGRVGMGGMDFYHTKQVNGNWETPVNFGYPVNSVKDDIYFTSNGNAYNILENVFFSSDRDAACCLELFTLQKANPLKQISGLVVDCVTNLPIANASVVVKDTINNKIISSLITDAQGKYSYILPQFATLKINGNANGYYTNNFTTGMPADKNMIEFTNSTLCLQPIVVNQAVVVNNVYYDYDKATLRAESYVELDKLIEFFDANPNIVVELSAHTDSRGSDAYNERLSDARAKSVVDYLVSKGIDRSKLIAKGYGESQPVAPNENADGSDNPEGRQQNRRTEFKVVKN